MDPPAGVVSSGFLALEDSPATNSKGVQKDRLQQPSGNKKLHPTMNGADFPADLLDFFWAKQGNQSELKQTDQLYSFYPRTFNLELQVG